MGIEDAVPPEAAAIVFHEDGSVSVMLPDEFGENPKAIVSDPVLAAHELLLRFAHRELTVQELADAYKRRDGSTRGTIQ